MKNIFAAFLLLCLSFVPSWAEVYPGISPTMTYMEDGSEVTELTYSGDAPFEAFFEANITEAEGFSLNWVQWSVTDANKVVETLYRDDQDFSFTFLQSGHFLIVCKAIFIKDGLEYEFSNEDEPITVTIATSKLSMPNAFSPNGDGVNDYYNAKQKGEEGCKSIVEFKATVFNRWGQKIYSWTDPYTLESGWDGTFHGQPVEQGVYFVRVDAKGADGTDYHIKKDVNLLRGYNEKGQSSGSDN